MLIALGVIPLLSAVHGTIVTMKRRPAKIPYPNCYATAEQAKSSPEAYVFNCAQRAHANFLENAPFAVMTMLAGGLTYPLLTAGLGFGWCFFRVLYLRGYVFSGIEAGKGRSQGSPFWLFQIGLLGTAVVTALKLI